MAIVSRRLFLGGALGGALSLVSRSALAASASPWEGGFHSRIRLVSGGWDGDSLLAGIDILLDPGFKTYWRTPGEAGLPPRFDWSNSVNVASMEMLWPAPERSTDPGGVSFGYRDSILFPTRVRPLDRAKPAELTLVADFGVCREICIPAHAELSLALSGDATHREAIDAARARVPREQGLGAQGPLSILSVEPKAGDPPILAVKVRAPAGSKPVLFPEGPENWYLTAPETLENDIFLVSVDERPKDAAGSAEFRFTLTAEGQAIETRLRLDASLMPG